MKTKQIIGIIVAALAFVFVCSASIFTKNMAMLPQEETAAGGFFSYLDEMSAEKELELPNDKFIGIVRVEGIIQASQGSSSMFEQNEGYDHSFALDYIDKMKDSASNEGILLYVDSPGGTVYEIDELYLKLMEYKEATGRPILAYFGSQACSGGYYIAMAADKIYANRNNWTGSIGVIQSMINYKELFDKYGIKEINITSGKNKAMGSSAQELTGEQKEILQSLIDEAYEQFVDIVAAGRKMDKEQVKVLADGRIYSAKQALGLNLIDKVGSYEEAVSAMREMKGNGYLEFFEPDTENDNFLTGLFSVCRESVQKSEVQMLAEELKTRKEGGLMYYANTGK